MAVRLRRELRTRCTIFVCLAKNEGLVAADIIAQRVKALESSLTDEKRFKGQHLVLFPLMGASPIDKDEESMIVIGEATHRRLSGPRREHCKQHRVHQDELQKGKG